MTTRNQERIQPLAPLTAAVFHILLALADGPKHGYAIMKQVATDAGSSLRMGPGTLYGSLQRMTAAGLVEEHEKKRVKERGEEREEDDERRRYYQLTIDGERALGAELDRLRQAVSAARRKKMTFKTAASR